LAAGYSPLKPRARRAITIALASTSVLLFPLLGSFLQLVTQTRLEKSLQDALQNRTITFEQAQIIDSSINWLAQPPQVNLIVSSAAEITPKQVRLLENFIEREMGQPFRLIMEISQVERVQREPVARLASIPTYQFLEALSGNQLSSYAAQIPRYISSNLELERSRLLATTVNWQSEPPRMTLTINASKPFTSQEQARIESIYATAIAEPFSFEFEVQKPEHLAALTNMPALAPGFNFDRIRQQALLEAKLYTSLRDLDVVVSQGEMITSRIDWSELSPKVLLMINRDTEFTERQVIIYRDFIVRRVGQPINLEVKYVASPVNPDNSINGTDGADDSRSPDSSPDNATDNPSTNLPAEPANPNASRSNNLNPPNQPDN
jgi:hypothetical protein